MTEKRKRGQNFSLEEKDKLVKILVAHKDTILNKKTDGTTNELKNNAWISVTNTFNSSATIYRNKDSLMKIWEKLKSESKIYYNNSRRSCTETGGGPSIIKICPVMEQVCAIVGRGCTGITEVSDCDADDVYSVVSTPKVFYIENLSPQVDLESPPIYTLESPAKDPENVECITNNTPLTKPMWSRRRPQVTHSNERTEAVSSICTSYQELNLKKVNLEDLKIQLLQEEINFKKQLYQLQLEAARKEVEIKNKILSQLIGKDTQSQLGEEMNNNKLQ